ncbi:MAG: hypothetical protein ACR2GF_06000 [Acidimicrobiales bacterium]
MNWFWIHLSLPHPGFSSVPSKRALPVPRLRVKVLLRAPEPGTVVRLPLASRTGSCPGP